MSGFLFVYGTLARNARHEMHQYLVRHADYAGHAVFNGQLFQVGHYPGAVPSSNPEDKVFGELYRVSDPGDLFAALDDYEGCGPHDPAPTEYVRRTMPVSQDGVELQAWIYLFDRDVTGLPRIMSGHFAMQGD